MAISIILELSPATEGNGKRIMNDRLHDDTLRDGLSEDKPFRMTELSHTGLTDIQEMADSLQILSQSGVRNPFRRNRFFGGICLALPLSGLLWCLFYYILHHIAV
jgi:hypothetical protein